MTREGIPLWFPWDPVHLAPEAYQELADAMATAGYTDEFDSASESASTASTGRQNRKRPELVITVPRLPAAKRGETTPDVRPADWQLGRGDRPSGTAHSHGRYYWHGSAAAVVAVHRAAGETDLAAASGKGARRGSAAW
jgi:hypothetical protein